MNFIVTSVTSHLKDRSKNFTHDGCEDQFYPKDSGTATEIDYAYALEPIYLYDIGAILTIVVVMFVISSLVLCVEILHCKFSRQNIPVDNLKSNTFHFSYTCKCANFVNVIAKLNQLHNCILTENGVQIMASDIQTTICELVYEVHISLVLKLNASEKEQMITNELQVLVEYLDTISLS